MGGCVPYQTEALQEARVIRDELTKLRQISIRDSLNGQIVRNLKRTHQIDDL